MEKLTIIKRKNSFLCIEKNGNKAGKDINILYKNHDYNKVKEFILNKGVLK